MKRASISILALWIGALLVATGAADAPKPEPTLQEQLKQLRALQEEVQAKLLAVPEEDQKRFAEFLKQPGTGLVKLLPRETYDRVLRIRGGGAYYSFVRRTHEYGHGSDIQLQQKRLSCGFAGGDYGYFLPLGDVPIEKAAQVEPGGAPQWAPAEAAKRWHEFWGVEPVDNRVLRDREVEEFRRNPQAMALPGMGVPDTPNRTYLLRSVSPLRSDILVVFRVEREFKEDGAILISWKLLNEFPVPNREQVMRGRIQQRQGPPPNRREGQEPRAK